MKRRTRIYYTPEQKAIILDRYKQGDSLYDIARIFGRFHSSIMSTIHLTVALDRPPLSVMPNDLRYHFIRPVSSLT